MVQYCWVLLFIKQLLLLIKSAREMWQMCDTCSSTLQLKQTTKKKKRWKKDKLWGHEIIAIVICLKCFVFNHIQLFSHEPEFLDILLFVYIYWKSLPFSFAISFLMSCVGVLVEVNIDHLLVIQIYYHLLLCHQLFPVKCNLI